MLFSVGSIFMARKEKKIESITFAAEIVIVWKKKKQKITILWPKKVYANLAYFENWCQNDNKKFDNFLFFGLNLMTGERSVNVWQTKKTKCFCNRWIDVDECNVPSVIDGKIEETNKQKTNTLCWCFLLFFSFNHFSIFLRIIWICEKNLFN